MTLSELTPFLKKKQHILKVGKDLFERRIYQDKIHIKKYEISIHKYKI